MYITTESGPKRSQEAKFTIDLLAPEPPVNIREMNVTTTSVAITWDQVPKVEVRKYEIIFLFRL